MTVGCMQISNTTKCHNVTHCGWEFKGNGTGECQYIEATQTNKNKYSFISIEQTDWEQLRMKLIINVY
jgi:hypothetical protein